MAREFLQQHGVDLDGILSNIQSGTLSFEDATTDDRIQSIHNVRLAGRSLETTWDIHLHNDRILSIEAHSSEHSTSTYSSNGSRLEGNGAMLLPSLCHPHVHLDKAYLLAHPRYSDLKVCKGDFDEAMTVTGEAKSRFQERDLLERGQRVLDESARAGVTHIRAFVEVDAIVRTKCLNAGLKLKRSTEARGSGKLQICSFAQNPLFSSAQDDEDGSVIRDLMQSAASNPEVEVLGSTPYVESNRARMERNVEWLIDLSIKHNKHLDFHLDYNLDQDTEPLVWFVIETLKSKTWPSRTPNKTVVLGHCTRLALFHKADWTRLAKEIGDLPISFVGLPTSDLFMMRTPDKRRGTLDVPDLIKTYKLNACLGMNNIGNAFTPQGSCDPLTLACAGIGLYSAGTQRDAELLYECVSRRAKRAIGVLDGDEHGERESGLEFREGDVVDAVLFAAEKLSWRTRKSVSELVYLYDSCRGRRVLANGRLIASGE